MDLIRRWLSNYVTGRILLKAFDSYFEQDIGHHAAALAYYTALSIVPYFAVFFGIAKGFGFLKDFDLVIAGFFSEHKEIYDFARAAAISVLQKTDSGLVGAVGALFLLWAVISILFEVENNLNRCWQCKETRSLLRRIPDYISLVLLFPIIFIIGNAGALLILKETIPILQGIFLGILPVFSTILLFAMLYGWLPNFRAPWQAVMLGSITAGLIYYAVQWVFVKFQIGVSSYNALYGSFAAIPLFLVWVQTSWVIFLMGAELSHAWYSIPKKMYHPHYISNKTYYEIYYSVLITSTCMERFYHNQGPVGIDYLAQYCHLTENETKNILSILVAGGILLETTSTLGIIGAVPAQPIMNIRLMNVLNTLGISHPPDNEMDHIKEALKKFFEKANSLEENFLLKDLFEKSKLS